MAKHSLSWMTLLCLLAQLQTSIQQNGDSGLGEDILRRLHHLETTVTRIEEDRKNLKEENCRLRKIEARFERVNRALGAFCLELDREEDSGKHDGEDKENINEVTQPETLHPDTTTSRQDEVSSEDIVSSMVVETGEKDGQMVLRVKYPSTFDGKPVWNDRTGMIIGITSSTILQSRNKGNHWESVLKTKRDANLHGYGFALTADNFKSKIIFGQNAMLHNRQEIALPLLSIQPVINIINFAPVESTNLSVILKDLPGYRVEAHVRMTTINSSKDSSSLVEYYGRQEDGTPEQPIIWSGTRRRNDEEVRSLIINPNGEDLEGALYLIAIYEPSNGLEPIDLIWNSYRIFFKNVHHEGPFPEGSVAINKNRLKQICYMKHTCIVSCYALGNRPVDVKIYKVTKNGRQKIAAPSDIYKREYIMSRLYRFSNVTEQDNGQYECEATSHTGQTDRFMKELEIRVGVRIIQDVTGVKNVTGKVTMRCSAQGIPEPTLTVEPWVVDYDGPPIQEGRYFHLQRQDTKDYLSLVITVLEPVQNLTHVRCLAKNEFEEDSKTFDIP